MLGASSTALCHPLKDKGCFSFLTQDFPSMASSTLSPSTPSQAIN
uniref:Uncharacterized protein n=1 Tax=Rhizophora mucronata TaxID=61149 RepID=A0A2P2LJM1_RHIMU